MEKVIIIGSGPAGYTAAIYAARANLAPVLFVGPEPGGQLSTTSEVENFPGFVKGVGGPEMMAILKEQAERFGTRVVEKIVAAVDFIGGESLADPRLGTRSVTASEVSDLSSASLVLGPQEGLDNSEGAQAGLRVSSAGIPPGIRRAFKIFCDEEVYEVMAVIVATGASAKRLGLENEKKLYGKGVSACATCDGFFFKGKVVAVVGGGDTAMEEANFLTKFASRVYVVHRREEFRASPIMLERARSNPKIEFIINTVVEDILGVEVGHVTGAVLRDTVTSGVRTLACDGVFAAIGHEPNTKIFAGQLELDQKGYIVIQPGATMTSVEGVFAAGDCADHKYRQAVVAAGAGCMAAIDAERWLEGW